MDDKDEERTVSHRTVAIDVEAFDLAGQIAKKDGIRRRQAIERAVEWYADDQAGLSPYRWQHRRVNLSREKPDDLSDLTWVVLLVRLVGRTPLEDVGKYLSLTRERVRQIEAIALRKHPEYIVTHED